MTAEPAEGTVTYYFSKVLGFDWLHGPKMGLFMVSVIELDLPTLTPLSEETTNAKNLIVDANG